MCEWSNSWNNEIFIKIKTSHPIWSYIEQWYVSLTLHISMLFTAHIKQKLTIVAPGKFYMHFLSLKMEEEKEERYPSDR